jgi:MFS family permease
VTETALPAPALHRQPNFVRLWTGQTISLFGDAVTQLALPLTAVLTLDASAFEMGLLTAAGLAPHLLLSLFAGLWIDRRRRRRRIMIAADLGRAGLLGSIALAAALGLLSLGQLYVVAFAVGALTVLFDLSSTSLFYVVVPRRDVVDANSKLSLSRSASWIGGQPLAGALVQALTAPYALVVDAFSFLASGWFIGRIDAEEPEVEAPTGAGVRERLAEGFRFVLGHPILRANLACTATVNFFNFVFFAIFVLYATRELGIRPGLLGAILGAGAVGAAVGSLLAPRVERGIGIGPTYVLGAIVFPTSMLLVPLAGGPVPLVAATLFLAEFLGGVGVMLFDIPGNSLGLVLTPHRLRARAGGTNRFVNYGVRPIGALLGGILGSTIGLRPTLWIAAVGGALGVLWLVASPTPRLRELPDQAT